MATIINNSATSEETIIRVHDPLFYVGDPTKDKALAGGQIYFGIPGRDPELEENQKLVYALQEDGTSIPLGQPVIVGDGGYPINNGSVVLLGVNGSYSYKVLDKNNVRQYYFPRIDANNLNGYSGVVVEEARDVLGQALTEPFVNIEATTATFYASTGPTGSSFNGRLMRVNVDYKVISTSEIQLLFPYPNGSVILGRQMDPVGQIVPIASAGQALIVFKTIADAKTANLDVEQSITIDGSLTQGDGLGGLRYIVVAGGTGLDDNENFIDLDNGNQLQLTANNMKLKRYVEEVVDVSSVSGNLNLDLEDGSVFRTILTESVTNILFINANSGSRTVTLRVKQDSAVAQGVSFAGIQWDGGTAPTISPDLDAVDVYVFTTFNGTTWIGSVVGQNIS